MKRKASGSAKARLTPTRPKRGKSTKHELIYQELRRSLMSGVFMPGTKVTLRSITEQIGTSVMPVREAINRLIVERALEMISDRRVIVPVMTAEKFAEIVQWRVQLEGAATRAACENITPEVIEQLDSINSRLITAVDQDRRDALLRANYEFHFAIYNASKSTILLPMIESLWLQAGPFTYFSTPSPRDVWSTKHHKEVIKALKSGDADTAVESITRDILSGAKFLMASSHFAKVGVRNISDLAA